MTDYDPTDPSLLINQRLDDDDDLPNRLRPLAIPLDQLRPHPKNYRAHPPDQIAHLAASLRANGQYRNVVVARDRTILAGHGVVLGAREVGWDAVLAVALDLDPDDPRALKILAGDNEIAHLGEIDDRALSEILKLVRDEAPDGLLGTGYDDAMLATLVMITRPASEIADFDAAAAWVGMPEYSDGERATEIDLRLRFENRDDLARCLALLGLPPHDPNLSGIQRALSSWWPPRPRADVASLRFVEAESPAASPAPDDDAGPPAADAPAEQQPAPT